MENNGYHKYICECNDLTCNRKLYMSRITYMRLSARGNVVHEDHVHNEEVILLDSIEAKDGVKLSAARLIPGKFSK